MKHAQHKTQQMGGKGNLKPAPNKLASAKQSAGKVPGNKPHTSKKGMR